MTELVDLRCWLLVRDYFLEHAFVELKWLYGPLKRMSSPHLIHIAMQQC